MLILVFFFVNISCDNNTKKSQELNFIDRDSNFIINKKLFIIIMKYKKEQELSTKDLITLNFTTSEFSDNNIAVIISHLYCSDNISNWKKLKLNDTLFIAINDSCNYGACFYNSSNLIDITTSQFECDTSEWKMIKVYKLKNKSIVQFGGVNESF